MIYIVATFLPRVVLRLNIDTADSLTLTDQRGRHILGATTLIHSKPQAESNS